MSWEDTFITWSAPPSLTEREKMENAETAIRKAVAANTRLSQMDVSIIPQGSYRSKTNVRLDSDVDIAVCLNSTFFTQYPAGKVHEDFGNSSSEEITFPEFRGLVQVALDDYFGSAQVTPGNKAFDIHSNNYRVDADVVATFAHRHYFENGLFIEPAGVAFLTRDTSKRIENWPHQAYENGKDKHDRTGRRHRKMVRILKRLRNKMQAEGYEEANDISSYLIESMVWNAADQSFNHTTYTEDVRAVLAYCFNETLPAGSHGSLVESNDIKYLFHVTQPWTREQAHKFFSAAWNYLGFQ
ncbi:MAG: nucleotidyltransferase [Patescibacteria group bacterium]